MCIGFGSEISGDLAIADQREWLVTNGLGSYASGTVGGTLTRSYHGLLIAALKPPVNRTLLVTKVDETVQYGDRTFPLFSNRWSNDSVDPAGNRYIQSFFQDGTIPTWQFTFGDALLEKRIWMQPGAHTTYVSYRLKRGGQPLKLSLKTLVNYRSHHGGTTHYAMAIEPVAHGVKVTAYDGATPFYLLSDRGTSQIAKPKDWYVGFKLNVEAYRGLNDLDDNLHASTLEVTLDQQEQSLTWIASTEPNPTLAGEQAIGDRQAYEQTLLSHWQVAQPAASKIAPDWVKQLVLAADQFIVERTVNQRPGKSVIAGYHWFNDWGRDTMISLPGLTLTTGRPEIAEQILRTFAEYISQGMLPNRFPDGKEQLSDSDYNTVDATLWYFEALRHHYVTTGNDSLIRDLFPKLQEIINHHRQGTRYNIKLDPNDGLLTAGVDGVQLTWMDAKVNGFVVTPRRGKPVEVNALWYNALRTMSKFAMHLGQSPGEYNMLADTTHRGFQRFWNNDVGYCFDVLDGPDSKNDPSLRPNQLFALSLPESLLTSDQAKKVLDACGQMLLTPHGVRSLTPNHAQYRGQYSGDQFNRDTAYHQGTVWGWLIGALALAYARTYGDPNKALQFLEPMAYHLQTAGLGSISEIFDGDASYHPRGCIAQAWSVAELLRVWVALTLSKPAQS
ncbi:MAG: glycogen debranching protein [Cyanothece sp. SIO1E1]|nr:glycogen debranching protein [Cyanothece sp. SIO1E1]